MKDKKVAGLWLDTEKAIVVSNHDTFEVTEFHIVGTAIRDVQHGNSNENAAHNAEITSKNKFFKEIEKMITNSEAVYVTGPGTAQEELKHHLADTAQFKNLKVTLDSAQHMNDNQVLEAVKTHFHA